jgi:hypothetical protein
MTSTHLTAGAGVLATRATSRRFYTGMAVICIMAVAVGFVHAERFRIRGDAPPLEPHVIAHAVLFASWFVIFLIQSSLVANGRVGLHRRLGVFGAIVAAAIAITGPLLAISATRHDAPVGELEFMLVMMGDAVGLGVFVLAAIAYRRHAETHKRLTLLGTISMLPPAVWRWPLVDGNTAAVIAVMLVFLAAAPIHDLVNGRRVHPASLWGGLALFLSAPLRVAISKSTLWHDIARMLVG